MEQTDMANHGSSPIIPDHGLRKSSSTTHCNGSSSNEFSGDCAKVKLGKENYSMEEFDHVAGAGGDQSSIKEIDQSSDVDEYKRQSQPIRVRSSQSFQSIETNGYLIEVSLAQRKYVGQCNNGDTEQPGLECEVYCGRLAKDILEHELIPLFEQYGPIWDLRLMMNSATLKNRGFAFVKFMKPESAKKAIAGLNNYPMRGSKAKLQVELCRPKVRLFVGNIPKALSKEELFAEFEQRTKGLKEVIIYKSPDDKKKNRGFCFLEYDSHACAFMAKKILTEPNFRLWNLDIIVDWADPVEEPEENVMTRVKILYVRNLTSRATEEKLKFVFSPYGEIERVKRIKDYAFVHFANRDEAEKALEALQDTELHGTKLEIMWSKPPLDKNKKEEMLRARERRMLEYQNHSNLTLNTLPAFNFPCGNEFYEYDEYEPYAAHYEYEMCHPQEYMLEDETFDGIPYAASNCQYEEDDYYCGSESPFHDYYGPTTPLATYPSSTEPPPMPRPQRISRPHYSYSNGFGSEENLRSPGRGRRRNYRSRERIPTEIIDNDHNWRENSGPSHINDFTSNRRSKPSWRK